MEPGWVVLMAALVVECLLVLLLLLPMPSNVVRGVITSWVKGLWNIAGVRYTILAVMALDIFYFLWILDALRSPLYDNWLSPIEMELTCEISMSLFRNERNLYITGFSLFMFLVLYRLIDIQTKLQENRNTCKELESDNKELRMRLNVLSPTAVPMGQPVEGKHKAY